MNDILTVLIQKVASSEDPTAPAVVVSFEIIDETLTLGLKFARIFEVRPFSSDARTCPVTA